MCPNDENSTGNGVSKAISGGAITSGLRKEVKSRHVGPPTAFIGSAWNFIWGMPVDQSQSAFGSKLLEGASTSTKSSEGVMTSIERFGVLVLFTILFGALSSAGNADPATPSSERITQYGVWSVVKKPATFELHPTGQRGRYFLCGAAQFAQKASLEFEAKNEKAWSVYVAAQGWSYRYGLRSLTIKSGSQKIRIRQAVYGGSMISAASHGPSGKPVSIEKLKSLIGQGEPISIFDNGGRKLVTFPNNGSDLTNAFNHAIKCSLEGVELLQQMLKDVADERPPDGEHGNGEDGTEIVQGCVDIDRFRDSFKMWDIEWRSKDDTRTGESMIVYGVFNVEGITAVCGFHMSKGKVPGGSLHWLLASSKIKSGSRVLTEDLRYFSECKQTDKMCKLCAACRKTSQPFRQRYLKHEFVPGTDTDRR